MEELQGSGKLILILGSSGSGKGTVLEALRRDHPDFVFPVSCTTRDPRPGEKNGEVYNFVSKEEFLRRRDRGDFLEWAVVHEDNFYGTLKEDIMKPLREGRIVVREVDVQGLRSIRELIPKEYLTSIFLTVDSWDTLLARILKRSDLPEEEIRHRHESFLKESKWADECDFVVENREGQVKETITQVEDAIESVV